MENKRIRVGINGFGRIGRMFTRQAFESYSNEIEIVAINDPGNIEAMAHLLEFDSIQGRWRRDISFEEDAIIIGSHRINVYHELKPERIPWGSLKLDMVLEGTGKFKTQEGAERHLEAGAPRCLITAVADGEEIKTIVLGANETILTGDETIISNASCTTNCAAPLVDVIDRNIGIESGYITTVHSYTGDQTLHDKMHRDLRRARAAALSIIPTTTGAAKAITRVFPHLDGALGGAGIRVPVPNASLTDMTYVVKNSTSAKEINHLFKEASMSKSWSSYLEYTEKPLVSSDIIGNTYSCIFDALLTSVIGKMVKVVGWYDNEMGYSSRLCDLTVYWSKLWDRP